MQSRPETGLLICSALTAILALAILSNATFTVTFYAVVLFGCLAFATYRFTIRNTEKRNQLDTMRIKKTSHLKAWIDALDALPTACVLLDKEKRVIHANKQAQDLATITTFGRPLTNYMRSAEMAEALDQGYRRLNILVRRETRNR